MLELYFHILEPQNAFSPVSIGVIVVLGVLVLVMTILFVVTLLWGKKCRTNTVVGKGKYNVFLIVYQLSYIITFVRYIDNSA